MAYDGWNNTHDFLSKNFTWYDMDEVIQIVYHLRDQVLGDSENIITSQDYMLTGIKCPASRDYRFPRDKFYVCYGIGEWGKLIDRLLLVASIVADPRKIQNGYEDFDSLGNLHLNLLDVIHKIFLEAALLKNVFGREGFESDFKLGWREVPETDG
ncbi:hypothetical protein BJV82DRAFT_580580 [Fennellomyces sp. T-0311]|nr:hypothetical protein BJV82DRAFT_580580 [Fennellomyces sp. T-0311]